MPVNFSLQGVFGAIAANKSAAVVVGAGALLLGGAFVANVAQPSASQPKVNVGYTADGKPYYWSTNPGGGAASAANAAANSAAQGANYVGVAQGVVNSDAVATNGAFTPQMPHAQSFGDAGSSFGKGGSVGSTRGSSAGQGSVSGKASQTVVNGSTPPDSRPVGTTVGSGTSVGAVPQNGTFTGTGGSTPPNPNSVGSSIGKGSSEGNTPTTGTSVGHGSSPSGPSVGQNTDANLSL